MSTAWKPKTWVSILIGIILQSMAFLYLQKPKLFWLYFIVAGGVGSLDWYFETYWSSLFSLICPVHAYIIAKSSEPTNIRKWYSLWWGIPAVYLIVFLPIFVIRVFLYEPFSMPASSMSPYLNIGDHLVVKKYGYGNYGSYGTTFLHRDMSEQIRLAKGKVYVFYPPHKEDVPFVKRLVGVPGDRVTINASGISINGENLQSRFVENQGDASIFEEDNDGVTYRIRRTKLSQTPSDYVVPDGSYFFLGDNRDNSSDSRYWGAVPKSRILGEVIYVLNR